VSLIVLLVFLAAVLWHRWRDPPLGAFYLVVIAYPAVLIAVRRPEYLVPRYFLVSVAFGLLAVSGPLAHFLRQGPLAKVAVAVALALSIVGNAVHTEELIRYGRVQYSSAVRYMESHTPSPVIAVTSNSDFPDRLILNFYQRFLQPGRSLFYYSIKDYPSDGTQWFLLNTTERSTQVPLEFQDPHGNTYRLVARYPHSILSGVSWHLYQRLQRASGQVPEPRW
jgi:hypothetical protein